MASARDNLISKMKKAQGYTEPTAKKVKSIGNEANPIVSKFVKKSNRETAAMAPTSEQKKINKDYAIDQPLTSQKRIGDIEDDPRFVFGGRDGSGNGVYQTEGPRIINRGGRTLLTNLSAGRLSNQFNNDLTQTPLQRELYNREGGFIKNNDTGVEKRIGGAPIDPKTIKILENIGMVKKGNMNKMDAPALSKSASIANKPIAQTKAIQLGNGLGSYGGSTVPISRRLDSPIIYNGQEEGEGPKHIRVGAPSGGGFFESLGNYSNAVRQNKERRSDERFNRKQDLAEKEGAADIRFKNLQGDWYSEDMQSKVNSRNALTTERNIKNAGLSEKLSADLASTIAETNKTVAETNAIIKSQPFKELILQHKAALLDAQAKKAGAEERLKSIEAEMSQMFMQQ